jgi:hypothetical protein
MAITAKEYNIDDLLTNLSVPKTSKKGSIEPKEYDVENLINNLQPYSETPVSTTPQSIGQNVLKGAEFFARNPVAPQFMSYEPVKEFGKGVASVLDTTIGSAIPSAAGYVTQAMVRPFTSPERSAEIAQNVSGALDKPFGKAFGITEEPAYKNEATNRAMQFVSENMDKGADWISQRTGLPKEDVANMMNSAAILATHQTNKYVTPAVKNAVNQVENQFTTAKNKLMQPTVAPEVQPTVSVGGQPSVTPIIPKSVEVLDPNTGKPIAVAQPAVVAERTFNVPTEQPINIAETAPLSQDILTQREALLNKIGLEDIRKSALLGNPKEAASQFITSQADQGPYGSGMTAQINTEKSALDNHFKKIQEESGGTAVRYGTNFQEGDKITVGKTIKDALQEGYDNHIKESADLYKEAEKIHGNIPVPLKDFNDFLKSDYNFAYTEEKGLQSAVKGFLERKGFLDDAGDIKPLTIAQSEEVRQLINKKYHYETKQVGGQLKALIDKDVFEQVGGETYEKARKNWQKGIQIYDNPKGIGDLLGDQGVNQKIPDEKVAAKVVTLPSTQFEHLFNTLESDGQIQAVNQVKSSLVDQIRQAGQSGLNQPFNSIAAAKEASKLSEKLKVAFRNDPKGLEAIYDGIEAADILHIPNKYPGAGVQTQLLKNKFSEMAVQRAGALVGGAGGSIFGPVGAGVGAAGGEYLGEKGASKLRSGRQATQLEKEIKRKGTPLNEVDEFKIKD